MSLILVLWAARGRLSIHDPWDEGMLGLRLGRRHDVRCWLFRTGTGVLLEADQTRKRAGRLVSDLHLDFAKRLLDAYSCGPLPWQARAC